MPECDSCGHTVEGSAEYCPSCGAPQQSATQKRQLVARVSYAIGFLFLVAGVSVLPDNPGGVPVVLGGIQLFPPMRHLLGRVLGRPPKIWANAALSGLLVVIGALVIYLL